MKLALVVMSLFLSLSSFAQSVGTSDWYLSEMTRYERLAAKVTVPRGTYTFEKGEAKMVISAKPFLIHEVEIRSNNKSTSYSLKNETDKNNLRRLIAQGAQIGSLSTSLVLPVVIDGVSFQLTSYPSIAESNTTIDWSEARYSGIIPGLPGWNPKYNRSVTITSDIQTGIVVDGTIYQVSLRDMLKSRELKLDVE